MSPLGTDGPEGQDEIGELNGVPANDVGGAELTWRRLAGLQANPLTGFGPARAVRDRLRAVVGGREA